MAFPSGDGTVATRTQFSVSRVHEVLPRGGGDRTGDDPGEHFWLRTGWPGRASYKLRHAGRHDHGRDRRISWESNMDKIAHGQLTRWQDAKSWAEGALARARAPQSPEGLLGIYLNDHLAGATGGMELAHRMAVSHHDPAQRMTLQRLAAEIVQDRRALLDLMAVLGLPVRRYKLSAAWAAEKAARLKLNGRLLSRSPLSSLEELEMLRMGVEGKAAGWRTLRVLADADSRLNRGRLDELMARARQQADLLEELRVRAAAHLIEAEPGTA